MSGVQLQPRDGRLYLPGGQVWSPPEAATDIEISRIVPRVCIAPDTVHRTDAATECIQLARSAGLILDPWQELAITIGLSETKLGRWSAFTVALIVSRQNGKGSILEALELYWLFLGGEKLIGHSAHEYKTAMEGFRRLLWLIDSNDWLRKRVKKVINTNGEEGIELLTGQRLRFMARSKGAGRGFTFHKLIWDEGYALTREQQDAQLPTMSAVDNPQIWVTSSPPLTSDTGEVLFQLRRIAQALGDQIAFLDYGAAGSLDALDTVDLDSEDLWIMANPSEVHAGSGHGVSLETMARERSVMSDPGFARERLGIWPPDLSEGYGVITAEQWARMLDPYSAVQDWEGVPATMKYWPEPDAPPSDPRWRNPPTALVGLPTISIDVSPRNQGMVTAALGVAQRREDGRRHVEVLARQTGTAWVIPWLRQLLTAREIGALAIDPGSPAGSLLADIENLVAEMGLSKDLVVKMASRDVASAFGILYDAAQEVEPSVVHLDQVELTVAIGGAVKRPVGDGHAWDRRNATTDLTPLVAITHALWALAQAPDEVSDEPLVVWS